MSEQIGCNDRDVATIEFSECRLGDFIALQRGYDLTDRDRRPGSVPVIGAAGPNGFHDTALVTGPGVTVGRSGGSFGQVTYCASDFWPHNTSMFVTDFKGNDPRFAYYLLSQLDFDGYNTGSAQPSLNRNYIYPIKIAVPPVEEQRCIARIVGGLDDKIELSREMNRTLCALAQRLFKSWFVDFDPVVAKSAGRKPYGLSDELAALFPSEFDDSEQGPIPRGWRLAPLDSIAEFRNGLAMQKYPPSPGESLPVLKIAELRAGSTVGADRASIDLDLRFVVHDGDLIFSWSGSLLVDVWAGGKAALNQHLFKVIPNAVPQWFCHQWLLEHLDDFKGIAADKATTMGHIRRHHLTDAKIVMPSEALLQELDRVMAPLAARQLQNKLQMRKLSALRDLLLPKLLLGEICVRAAERVVEDAA